MSNSRGSSQTLVSQLSSGSSSTSKPSKSRVSIGDLRAEAQVAARDGYRSPISIEDGDELARNMSGTFSLGSEGVGNGVKEPDFGSDDSDGPPEEDEEDETEMENAEIV